MRFSPQICLRQKRAIFIEIGKCQNLYTEAGFIARAGILLRRLGYAAKLFIGGHITEALTLARYNAHVSIESLPLSALLDFADPFSRDEVLQKSVQNMIDSFQDLGIKTIGDFKKLPVGHLISRYGVVGRVCHQRAHCQDFIAWPTWQPEETIQVRKEFSSFEFYGELEPILFELKAQLDHIFARLYGRRQRAMKLQVQIICEKISTHPDYIRTLNFDFFAPQGSTKGTLRIFQERLTREFAKKPLRSPVEAVQTRVTKAVHHEAGQKNIFNNQEEKLEQIYTLHNQLIEMLGKENIYQAELTEDRRPERSWKKNYGSPHEVLPPPANLKELLPERATYLCRYPIRIEVTAGYVHIKKKKYRILNWDNAVERISGGWFEKPEEEVKNTFDRNYYYVELEKHQRITIFETPLKEYYLHGYYG
ncbi:MAG: hypothetical protein EOP06_12375 [Proteobacteria bacterium]|nr:MAG: hypothetical protein EOP06_12375 [Pseudomonadota bacterium]